ncbi:glycosyltransferase [Pelagibacterium halotolerans]|uniref:glycosyltransferase n=1 Tax=Pelagibacterium halotolerans TaxID=531813 RepID=UPI00059FDABF|nr:glycosyltransferase [Pelagibacterium halotolerans]QJR17211.1 hypothetical protein HKM20_01290 [Pelagibacterium halotolerans]SEA88967.1 Glycosyltransferase involved in cell wall bisynthesis [Pelagibacterium halotolerans]
MASILFIHPAWQVGGVERTNIQWAKALLLDGHSITFATTHGIEKPADVPQEISWVSVGRDSFALFRKMISFSWNFDITFVCQSYLLPRLIAGQMLNLRFAKNVILAERNAFEQYNGYGLKGAVRSLIAAAQIRSMRHVVVNSEYIRNQYPFSGKRDVKVVQNPRFDNEHDVLPDIGDRLYEPERVVFIGRWDEQKDTEFLLKFDGLCRKSGWDFLAFCGRTDLPFQRNFLQDPLQYMASEKIALLFCSKFEGYPNMLVEARAAGIPILAAHCPGGSREILAGYDNTVEFSKQNDASVVEALCKLRKTFRVRPDRDFVAKHCVQNSEIRGYVSSYLRSL